jgi:hypothetical protein
MFFAACGEDMPIQHVIDLINGINRDKIRYGLALAGPTNAVSRRKSGWRISASSMTG